MQKMIHPGLLQPLSPLAVRPLRLLGLAVLLLTCGLTSLSVTAAELSGLYEADALVYSQQTDERTGVMGNALADVLVKVSGRASAISVEGLQTALNSPASYLQLYRYRPLTDAELGALEASLAEVEENRLDRAQIVSFRFDKGAVDKLLQQHQLPIWGSTRPSTLIWLAIQDDNRRYLLGSDDNDDLRGMLSQAAQRRGLALLFPLMDLQDQATLRFADVWGGFPGPVLDASIRYRSESVLMGRIYPGVGNKWRGQWTLIESGRSQSWSAEDDHQQGVIAQGVAGAAEALAALYAPILAQQTAGMMPVLVTDITSTADYARVMSYLQSLQEVASVVVNEVNPDQVTFQLGVKGSPESLAKTIGLGNVLVPDKNVFISSGAPERQGNNIFGTDVPENGSSISRPGDTRLPGNLVTLRPPSQTAGGAPIVQAYRLLP